MEKKQVSRKPRNGSFAEAATIPLAAETALTALEKAGLKPGVRVMVIGAAGGCGIFAIQIARALGATEVVAVVSGRHTQLVKRLGADTVIDYTTSSIRQSGVNGIDVVFDTVGGYWEEAKDSLAPSGQFVSIAFWEPRPRASSTRRTCWRRRTCTWTASRSGWRSAWSRLSSTGSVGGDTQRCAHAGLALGHALTRSRLCVRCVLRLQEFALTEAGVRDVRVLQAGEDEGQRAPCRTAVSRSGRAWGKGRKAWQRIYRDLVKVDVVMQQQR